MPENLIYSDFEKRRADIKQEIAVLNQNIKNTENLIRSADSIQNAFCRRKNFDAD